MEDALDFFFEIAVGIGLLCADRAHEISSSGLSERLFHRNHEPAQLLEMSDQVIEARPREAEGYFVRGMALDALGRPAEAVTALERAVQLRPDHARAWMLLSETLRKCGDYDRSRQTWRMAVELDPRLR